MARSLGGGNTKYFTLWATGLVNEPCPSAPDLNARGRTGPSLPLKDTFVKAELGEYGGGVLPDLGVGAMTGSASAGSPGGSRARTGPAGEPTLRQRLRARSCGWFRNSRTELSLALAIPASSSFSMTSSALRWPKIRPISSSRAALWASLSELLE
jgi:hypothetical protein